MKPESARLAIFDCDGVVLQSNHLKSEAFRRALEGEPTELVDKFIAYHKAHGGISRYHKFDHYFRSIHPTDNPAIAIECALSRYARIVETGLLNCPETPGVTAALEVLRETFDIYLVSGGDEEELRDVFRTRDLDRYFEGIFGSPSTKRDILSNLSRTSTSGLRGVYFGDSELDMITAEEFGLQFVLVFGTSEWTQGRTICVAKGYPAIEDFLDPQLSKLIPFGT